MRCTPYLHGDIEAQVIERLVWNDVDPWDIDDIFAFLGPLGTKGEAGDFHRQHSLRVGLVASRIARHIGRFERPLLIAGLLHDVGKALVPICTLAATRSWTDADKAAMEAHVLDGFRLLRDRFDFSAHVIAHHHRHQGNPYPKELPTPLPAFSKATLMKIERCGRLLAIADVFDALHRINSATAGAALDDAEIERRMLDLNKDEAPLVRELLDKGVLPKIIP